jgi:UPF0755 protein
VALAAGAAYYWVRQQMVLPGPLEKPLTLVIPKGVGSRDIGHLLEARGVIKSSLLFRGALRLESTGKPLRAGEYEFPARVSVADAVALLQSGKTVLRRFTVPEGLTVAEILAIVKGLDGASGSVTSTPPEGSLLPQTYFYSYGDSRDAIVQRMRQAMAETLDELWPGRQDGLPFATKEAALTLASIVEKETGIAEERPRVAAVFINRLRRGMRLESDPTVVYGITHGLPAGPIAIPGLV